MVTDSGIDLSPMSFGGEGVLLDYLAEVHPSRHPNLATGIEKLRRDGGGLVVAVVGMLSPGEAQQLASSRSPGTTAVAVFVDATSWVNLSSPQRTAADARYNDAAHALLVGGWRVLRARHGARLDALWPYAAARGGEGSFAAGGEGPATGGVTAHGSATPPAAGPQAARPFGGAAR
jgi:hypothetical protein